MSEKTYNMDGKSLLITAKVDGFRRGGIAHPARETLHKADEFTPEQLAQILAENGKDLIVKVVEVKKIEAPTPEVASNSEPKKSKTKEVKAKEAAKDKAKSKEKDTSKTDNQTVSTEK